MTEQEQTHACLGTGETIPLRGALLFGLAGLLGAVLCRADARAAAAADQVAQAELDRIVAGLQKRQTSLNSVRYRLEGKVLIPKGWHTRTGPPGVLPAEPGELPPEDYEYPQALTYILDFVNNRLRRECRGETFYLNKAVQFPTFEIDLFDGERLQRFAPRAENGNEAFTPGPLQPELYLQKHTYFGLTLNYEDEAVFLAHAKFPTTGRPPGRFERLFLPLDVGMLHWHGRGVVDGRSCIVLRTPAIGDQERFYEYWVDAEREDEVVRYRCLIDGRERTRLDIRYRTTPTGRWLQSFRAEETELDGSRGLSEEMTVVEFADDPRLSDALFHVEPSVGMIVHDAETGHSYQYRGPGKENVDVSELDRDDTNSLTWLAVAALAGLAVILAIAVLRRRKPRVAG